MEQWSQSHFLQALGWATLNSFWQMAILWCAFIGVNHLFKLSATKVDSSSRTRRTFQNLKLCVEVVLFFREAKDFEQQKDTTAARTNHTIILHH